MAVTVLLWPAWFPRDRTGLELFMRSNKAEQFVSFCLNATDHLCTELSSFFECLTSVKFHQYTANVKTKSSKLNSGKSTGIFSLLKLWLVIQGNSLCTGQKNGFDPNLHLANPSQQI